MLMALRLFPLRRDVAYANLMTQVGVLAFHKNASNVYEKLIIATEARRMTPQQLGAFYQRLLRDAGNRAEPGPLLDRLIPHQYGNYIVSSCLAVRCPPNLHVQALWYSCRSMSWHAAPCCDQPAWHNMYRPHGTPADCQLGEGSAEARF